MNMIEKVARAINSTIPDSFSAKPCPKWETLASWGGAWVKAAKKERKIAMQQARAAIEAMREPSNKMRERGHRAHTADPGDGLYFDTIEIWRAMIDEALKKKE